MNLKSIKSYKEKVQIHLEGIPMIKYYGQQKDFNVLIMQLLGPSIDDLLIYCKGKFILRTVLLIADQLVFLIKDTKV